MSDISFADVHVVIGRDLAARLAQVRAGRRVYIPHDPTANCVLAVIIGLDAAIKLADRFGGETVEVPTGRVRDAQIIALADQGASRREIAHRLLVSVDTVDRVLSRRRPAAPSPQLDLFSGPQLRP